MKQNEITEAIKLLQAASDGNDIEWRYKGKDGMGWLPMKALIINFNEYDYRIKQEPLYIPLESKDFDNLPLVWIKYPQCKTQVMVTEITEYGIFVGTSKCMLKWQFLYDAKHEWSTNRKDWKLCRKESYYAEKKDVDFP